MVQQCVHEWSGMLEGPGEHEQTFVKGQTCATHVQTPVAEQTCMRAEAPKFDTQLSVPDRRSEADSDHSDPCQKPATLQQGKAAGACPADLSQLVSPQLSASTTPRGSSIGAAGSGILGNAQEMLEPLLEPLEAEDYLPPKLAELPAIRAAPRSLGVCMVAATLPAAAAASADEQARKMMRWTAVNGAETFCALLPRSLSSSSLFSCENVHEPVASEGDELPQPHRADAAALGPPAAMPTA